MPTYVFEHQESGELIERDFYIADRPDSVLEGGKVYRRIITSFNTPSPSSRMQRAKDVDILKEVDETPSAMDMKGDKHGQKRTPKQMEKDGDLIPTKSLNGGWF
jgi:hypothetical protein